jgi:thioredoxin reductase (NADPH)
MQEKVKQTKNIRIEWNTQVLELLGETKLEKAKLTTEGKGEWELPLDGLFVAIGHTPSTDLVRDALSLDEIGFIKPTPSIHTQMSTNIQGVFVAGDVHDRHYKQAITAAGFGAMAALETLSFLDKSGPSW